MKKRGEEKSKEVTVFFPIDAFREHFDLSEHVPVGCRRLIRDKHAASGLVPIRLRGTFACPRSDVMMPISACLLGTRLTMARLLSAFAVYRRARILHCVPTY